MQISVISDHQSTVIVHPPEAAFNDPTPAVSLSHTDGTATTAFAAFSLNGGNGGLDSSSAQPNSKRTAVISFVSHQFLGPCSGTPPPLRDPNRFQGGFRQPDFMMVGAVQIQTDRHPVSIRYHHDLGSLAHLGFSNPVSPFLAGTNRPSIHSTQQRTPNPLPRPVFRPLFQPPPTGGGRTILSRHVRPSTTGFQDVENSVQCFSRICGRTSGSRFWFGKKRFNHSPLFVCQLMSRTHTSILHWQIMFLK